MRIGATGDEIDAVMLIASGAADGTV